MTKKAAKKATTKVATIKPSAPQEVVEPQAATAPVEEITVEPTPAPDAEPAVDTVEPTPEPASEPEIVLPAPGLALSAKACRYLRAILIACIKPEIVDANLERIKDHIEKGLCVVVTRDPWGIDLSTLAQQDSSIDSLRTHYGVNFQFEASIAMRAAQVL